MLKTIILFCLLSILLKAFPDCPTNTNSVYLGYNFSTYDSAIVNPNKLPIEEHTNNIYKRTAYDRFISIHTYNNDGSVKSYFYAVKHDFYQCIKPYEPKPTPICSKGTYPKLIEASIGTYGNIESSSGWGCNLADFNSKYPLYSDIYNKNSPNEYYTKLIFIEYIMIDKIIGYIHCPTGSSFNNPSTIYANILKETYKCVSCDQNDTAFPPIATNQEIIDAWNEPNDRSAQCS